MAEYLVRDTTLISLSDSIRSLGNTTKSLSMSEMKTVVDEAIIREDGIIDESTNAIQNNRVTSIRQYSFYKNQSLSTVNFPSAVIVDSYAFYKCDSLVTTNIPLVESIGVFSFRGCSSLILADFPLVTTIGQGCFDECIALSSVNLPLVTVIEPLTFRKCEGLTTVDLPVVTSIGSQAFYSSGITSLTLRSDTVCTLDNADAFYFTPIEEGVGYIYVPSDLVDSYKTANGWSTYANQIIAIA